MTAGSADLERIAQRLAARGETFPARAAIEIGVALLEVLGGAHAAWTDRERPPACGRLSARAVRLAGTGEVRLVGDDAAPGPRAPEVVAGGPCTPQSDVYAAAALVVELLTAEPIGEADGEADHEARVDARMEAIAHQLGGSHPARATLALLRVALAPTPCDRPEAYALAEAFADLARALPGERLDAFAARVIPVIEGAAAPVPSGIEPQRTVRPALAAPSPRAGRPVAGLVAAVLAAIGLAGGGAGVLVALAVLAFGTARAPGPQPVAAPTDDPTSAPPVAARIEAPLRVPLPDSGPPEVAAADEALPAAPARPAPRAVAPPQRSERPRPSAEARDAPDAGRAGSPSDPVAEEPAVAEAEAAAEAPVRLVDRAMVSIAEAERLVVACGDRRAEGTRSVRLTRFPAGSCTVRAWVLGRAYEVPVAIERVGQWTCEVGDEGLSCDG